MYKLQVFESETAADFGNVTIICRSTQTPAEAVMQLDKPTWLYLKSDDDLLDEFMRVALKLSGETLQQLRKHLDEEHRIRHKFFSCGIEYRQKVGVKIHRQGESLSFLIRLYEGNIFRGITNTERRLSALCSSEIFVNVAGPGRVHLYELSIIYKGTLAA